jgi:hypothetical protein
MKCEMRVNKMYAMKRIIAKCIVFFDRSHFHLKKKYIHLKQNYDDDDDDDGYWI